MTEIEMKKWILLKEAKGVGPVTAHRLLDIYGGIKEIPEDKFQPKDIQLAEEICCRCIKDEIDILTLGDGLPTIFRDNQKLPILLYRKSNCNPRRIISGVGIVGARRCTEEGKQAAIMLAQAAVSKEQIVISGMAKGIDSYSHTAAIKSRGQTIAVLGCGPDICYPAEHKKLKESIIENGAILSEYPPGTKPGRYMFPRRNRIISALSEVLYVIDAGEKSGTRTTIQAAEEYGSKIVMVNKEQTGERI